MVAQNICTELYFCLIPLGVCRTVAQNASDVVGLLSYTPSQMAGQQTLIYRTNESSSEPNETARKYYDYMVSSNNGHKKQENMYMYTALTRLLILT